MRIEVCFSPILYEYCKSDNDTVVVADILRASTSICSMLQNGAKSVIPIVEIEDAMRYHSSGYLVAAERNGEKCDFADFGNSPFDFLSAKIEDKDIVFTTTNGTRAVKSGAKYGNELLIGAFSNINKITSYCIEHSGRVVVICAGWENNICLEDILFGGALADKLMKQQNSVLDSDAAKIAYHLWKKAQEDPLQYLSDSEHYHRMMRLGLDKDLSFCLEMNTIPVLPKYDKEKQKIVLIY